MMSMYINFHGKPLLVPKLDRAEKRVHYEMNILIFDIREFLTGLAHLLSAMINATPGVSIIGIYSALPSGLW